MGKLVNGKWSTEWYSADAQGGFVREDTKFRDRVSADGSSGFKAESGRYHLYVSLACPWAHRTLIMRRLKGLADAISISVVHPHMDEDGWEFREAPGTLPDTVNGARFLRDVYLAARADYTGRVTVPVLWDRQTRGIVSNESRAILRMLDHEFSACSPNDFDYCPSELEAEVDREIDALYRPVNNGVYRAGFATKQGAYEQSLAELFEALDGYEERLSRQRYLLGSIVTEADVCFFTTLVRFDAVYHYHFKCNVRKIADYPRLSQYLRDLYQLPGVAETCDVGHIKEHYYTSHPHINPTLIIPRGPILDLTAPHDRARLGRAP